MARPTAITEPADVMMPSKKGDPAWNLALLFPRQGAWTEAAYLALDTNNLVELVDGNLEVLPMPTTLHQRIVKWLFQVLNAFVVEHQFGEVFFAPLRIRLFPGQIREPDIVFLRPDRIVGLREPPRAADLVMEVVSEGAENHERDYQEKRAVYARADIAEYWIVDPHQQIITVLTLDGGTYRVHGEFAPGTEATSVMFPEFKVDVTAVFTAGQGR
jgi:Uma2 family endonuclease